MQAEAAMDDSSKRFIIRICAKFHNLSFNLLNIRAKLCNFVVLHYGAE